MTDMIRIKPGADRRVRHEDGRLLEDAGETVPRSSYWLRRLADEDVVLVPTDDKPRTRRAQGDLA